MKSLKFQPHLRDPILDGSKTITWRFFDDKDIQVGDELEFFVSGDDRSFGHVSVIKIESKKVGELTQDEMSAHGYHSIEEVIEAHNTYYGGKITEETPLKIIYFSRVKDPYQVVNPYKYSPEEIAKLPIAKKVRAAVFLDENTLICTEEENMEQMVLGMPGGGIEEGEDNESALRREVREEVGYEIKNISFLGTIEAVRESYRSVTLCYQCEVEGVAGELKPTEKEIRAKTHPVIVKTKEAHMRCKNEYEKYGTFHSIRSVFILEHLKKNT